MEQLQENLEEYDKLHKLTSKSGTVSILVNGKSTVFVMC